MGKRELLLIVAFLVLGGRGLPGDGARRRRPSGGRRSIGDFIRRGPGARWSGPAPASPSTCRYAADVGDGRPDAGPRRDGRAGRDRGRGRARTSRGQRVATLLGENESGREAGRRRPSRSTAESRRRPAGDSACPTPTSGASAARAARPSTSASRCPARLALVAGRDRASSTCRASPAVTLDTDAGQRDAATRSPAPSKATSATACWRVSGAGSVDIETRRVNVRLEGIEGTVEVEANDGGVEAKGLSGPDDAQHETGAGRGRRPGRDPRRSTDRTGAVEMRGLERSGSAFDGTRLPLRGRDEDRRCPSPPRRPMARSRFRLPAGRRSALKLQADEGTHSGACRGSASPFGTGPKTTLEAKIAGGGPLLSMTVPRARSQSNAESTGCARSWSPARPRRLVPRSGLPLLCSDDARASTLPCSSRTSTCRSLRRGKVRDVYEAGPDQLLIVATDRISAFDYVLGSGIPDKGRILSQISVFWFGQLADIVPNHLLSDRAGRLPRRGAAATPTCCAAARCWSAGPTRCRSSAWRAATCRAPAGRTTSARARSAAWRCPPGLVESVAPAGADLHAGHEGRERPRREHQRGPGRRHPRRRRWSAAMRDLTLALYRARRRARRARRHHRRRHEVRVRPRDHAAATQRLLLIDEALTPDSSRFWPADQYAPGGPSRASTSSSCATTSNRSAGTSSPRCPRCPRTW